MRLRASILPLILLLATPAHPSPARAADEPLPLFGAPAPTRATAVTAGPAAIRVRLDHAAVARLRAARGGRVELPLPDGDVVLDLHPAAVLAPGAVVTTTGAGGARPLALDLTVLAGAIPGEPGSIATLTLSDRGVQGVVLRQDRRYTIAPAPSALGDHAIVQGAPGPRTAFECAADLLPRGAAPPIVPRAGIEQPQAPFPTPTRLICTCAVDCDYEFTNNKFGGDTLAAAAYVLTVYATISQIYERDLNVTLQVVYLNEWTTVNDPYDQTTLQDQLNQFTGWWVTNRSSVSRNLAELLSGRALGGGIAWIHALCNVNKGYAVIQWDANQSYPNPSTTWDVEATAHELGHNFGSEHTHSCFWQTSGFVPPGALLDSCYTAEGTCYSGPTGIVPSVKGTIMSYCHTLFPGMSNIRLEFHDACKQVMRGEAEVSCFAAAAVQPPRQVIATVAPGGNAINWLPSLSSGVLRYRIYRGSLPFDPHPPVLDSTTSTIYVDPSAGGWYYKVRAVRATDQSGWSNEVRAAACAPTNPTTQAVGAGPVALLAGRFNDDALADLAAVNGDGASVSILLAQRFTPSTSPFAPAVNVPVGTHPVAIAAADFDADGALDLAVAIADSSAVTTLRGQTSSGIPTGSFVASGTWPAGGRPRALAVADVNEDGIPDLLVACGSASAQLAVLAGQGAGGIGNGTFGAPALTAAAPGPARGLAIGDWNADGITDVAITDSSEVAVLLGQGTGGRGNGAFGPATRFAAGSGAQGIATGDFNHDGRTDLAIACAGANVVAVLLGNGSGGFAPAVTYPVSGGPTSIVAGDWNEDGIEDLATTNAAGGTIGILFGQGAAGVGNGTFATVIYGSVGSAPRSVLSFEFNDDGRPDLALVNGVAAGRVAEVPVNCAGPYGASVHVVSPAAGAVWVAPGEHTIAWTKDPAVPEVSIELSRDGGASWQTLASHVTGTSWTWTATDPYTANAHIRVADVSVAARMDTSAAFTVIPQSLLGVAPAAAPVLAIRAVVPTPSAGDLTVWLVLPRGGSAWLELLDVAGRRVRGVALAGAGAHSVSLARGRALASGIYLVRLTQGGRIATAKAVVVR